MEGGMKLEASIGIPIPRLAYIPGGVHMVQEERKWKKTRRRKGAKGEKEQNSIRGIKGRVHTRREG